MNWSILNFGKYEDKSLPQIIFSDPDYFFWGYENNVFAKNKALKEQSEILYRRARSVKIPNNDKGLLEVEHIIHAPTSTYGRFDIEPIDKPVHKGGSPAYRSKLIDFMEPRSIKGYDKSGYKQFLASFKHHVLGNSKVRLTKKVAEEFWSNSQYFDNP